MCSGCAPSNPFKNTDISVTERCVCVWQRCWKRRHITQRVTTVSRLEKVKQPQESVTREQETDRSLAGLQQAVRGEEGRSAGRPQVYGGCSRSGKKTAWVSDTFQSKCYYIYNELCSRDHRYVMPCCVSVFALVISSSFCWCTVVSIRHIGCYGFHDCLPSGGKFRLF